MNIRFKIYIIYSVQFYKQNNTGDGCCENCYNRKHKRQIGKLKTLMIISKITVNMNKKKYYTLEKNYLLNIVMNSNYPIVSQNV